MIDDEKTILCFFNIDSINRVYKTFPSISEEHKNLLFSYLKAGIVPVVVKKDELINPKSKENIEKQKEELKKRFCFIYENSKELLEEYSCPIQGRLGFNFMNWLEEFLLGNIPLEESALYKYFLEENKKKDKKELDEEYSTVRVKHYIWNKARVVGEKSKYMWELLSHLVYFIRSRNDINSYNNEKELEALDEYFRILRYSNDGIEWVSGYDLVGTDLIHALLLIQHENEDMVTYGVSPEFEGNEFLSCFASGPSKKDSVHLTEKEKQELYLKYHDELPWDLTVECQSDETLKRPEITIPCGSINPVRDIDIFVGDNKKYYCMCRDCGYIISIPDEVLSDKIKKKINDQCNTNKDLFRKMMIYSELQALDRESKEKILIEKEDKNESYGYSYIMSKLKNKGGK